MRVVVDIYPAGEEKSIDLSEGATGIDLMKSLGLAPDSHLLVRGEIPIPLDEPLLDRERLLIISVVSGGVG